jgi:thymidylate kinase
MLGLQTKYLDHNTKNHDLLIHIVRAQDELHEAARNIPSGLGGQRKSRFLEPVKRNAFKEEVADAFLFMVNAMNIMEIDPSEFFEMCNMKQVKNFNRIANKERFKTSTENPIIIIDGPDGVGKSEICKKLSEIFQVPLIRMPHPENMDDVEKLSKQFNMTIDQVKSPMILDRGFPSSLVYSEHFGRNTDLSYLPKLFTDREVIVFIVVAKSPYRGDWFIKEDDFEPIKDLYIKHANIHKWEIINNDVSLEDSVNQITTMLQS